MAEGMINHFLPDKWQAYSAGIGATAVNPQAVEVMTEIEIDISHQRSKSIAEFNDPSQFDLIITVCDAAAEACPVFNSGIQQVHIGFNDPTADTDNTYEIAIARFREVRDDIRARLIGYLRHR